MGIAKIPPFEVLFVCALSILYKTTGWIRVNILTNVGRDPTYIPYNVRSALVLGFFPPLKDYLTLGDRAFFVDVRRTQV